MKLHLRSALPPLLLLIAGLSLPAVAPPLASLPHADSFGDPLPAGVRARLGTMRFRLDRVPGPVALSADGRFLAVAVDHEAVYLLDGATGKELQRIPLPIGASLNCLAISPDGKVLAGRHHNSPVLLWNARTGRELRRLKIDKDVTGDDSLAFSADSKWLTFAGSQFGQPARAAVWEVATGTRKGPFQPLQSTRVGSALSPDGKLLATWGSSQTPNFRFPPDNPGRIVHLWEVRTGKAKQEIMPENFSLVVSAAFSPDGKRLAVSNSERIIVASVATGKQIDSVADRQTLIAGLAWSPDGKYLAASTVNNVVKVWQLGTNKRVAESTALSSVNVARFSPVFAFPPGGRILAAVARGHSVSLWEPLTDKLLTPDAGHWGPVSALTWASNGKQLVSADNATICFWNPASGKQVRTIVRQGNHQGLHPASAFSPDGRYLYTGEGFQRRLIDTATGKEVYALGRGYLSPFAVPGVFSPNSERLAFLNLEAAGGSAEYVVSLLEVATGRKQVLGRLKPIPNLRAICLDFSPDGKHLAIAQSSFFAGANRDGCEMRLWEVAGGKEVWKVKHPSATVKLVFAPHGRLLAAAGLNRLVQVLDAKTGKPARSFSLKNEVFAGDLVFSPDGRTLAIAVRRPPSQDGAVQLWEVITGSVRHEWRGHRGGIGSVAFSADGRTLATGGADTSILLWDVPGMKSGNEVLTAAELNALWADLEKGDGIVGSNAIGRLMAAPKSAVAFLQARVRPTAPQVIDARKVEKWIEQLDDEDFTRRTTATRELAQAGTAARAALHKALAAKPSLEVTRRVEALLDRLADATLEKGLVRPLRAVEALERMGTPEARKLLTTLAKGDPDSPLTRDAGESLARLQRLATKP